MGNMRREGLRIAQVAGTGNSSSGKLSLNWNKTDKFIIENNTISKNLRATASNLTCSVMHAKQLTHLYLDLSYISIKRDFVVK
jgi:hypothetical protein